MRSKSQWRIVACAIALFGVLLSATSAAPDLRRTADRLLQEAAVQAGVPRSALVPDLQDYALSATRERRSPWLQAAMQAPDQIPRLTRVIERNFRAAALSPARVMARTAELPGWPVDLQRAPMHTREMEARLWCVQDPLSIGLQALRAAGQMPAAAHANAAEMRASWHLRHELARVLVAIGNAERLRGNALAAVAQQTTPEDLLRQVTALDAAVSATALQADYRRLLSWVDRARLHEGMQHLVVAVERLDRYLALSAGQLPVVDWRWSTPLGAVVVDTTARDSIHDVRDPLLIVDIGGDDTYLFAQRAAFNRISIVLDRGGNDRYVAQAAGADPSAAVMGYGILWDAEGDDRYEGETLAQAAALFGEALHFDGAGNDAYRATSLAQGFALGGAALLLSRGGDDQFTALTHAQGSAGPEGVAVLMDTAGNDRYVLGNEKLVLPSSQVPDRNVSMGQGAGRGERGRPGDALSASGGVGLLLDLEGNDSYTAQVFAQGVGYYEGVGLLIDGGGQDRFTAAWYAMAAAAHQAVGVLIQRGRQADVYQASHSTAIGAAHDVSVAVFVEEGGDDTYALGNLGFGAAHDNSVALFFEGGGRDRYVVHNTRCQAFGVTVLSDPSPWRQNAPGLGLFLESSAKTRHAQNRRARLSGACPRS
jgi:hypothetical protein